VTVLHFDCPTFCVLWNLKIVKVSLLDIYIYCVSADIKTSSALRGKRWGPADVWKFESQIRVSYT